MSNELGKTPADKNYQPSGISRAEERALERFPEQMTPLVYQDVIDAFGGKTEVDFNLLPRSYFQLGYEQAEKDLQWEVNHTEEAYQNGYVAGLKERLTWEDVKRIVEFADSLMPYASVKLADLEYEFQSEEAYYKEVLRKYNGE